MHESKRLPNFGNVLHCCFQIVFFCNKLEKGLWKCEAEDNFFSHIRIQWKAILCFSRSQKKFTFWMKVWQTNAIRLEDRRSTILRQVKEAHPQISRKPYFCFWSWPYNVLQIPWNVLITLQLNSYNSMSLRLFWFGTRRRLNNVQKEVARMEHNFCWGYITA